MSPRMQASWPPPAGNSGVGGGGGGAGGARGAVRASYWVSPWPRPHTLVAVAKDAASVAGQHGGGVATSAVSRQGRRCGSCRLHHSRERRCAGTGAAAANFPASVTRGLRDGVLGGPEEAAGAAMREALGASREAVLR